jgi:hypothetical protein
VLVFIFFGGLSWYANARTPADTEMEQILLSWALKLTGRSSPVTAPVVEYVPHQYFVENACGGNECKVWGWYPNTGGNTIYVDERFHEILFDGSDGRSLLGASIIVHEMVHYIQAVDRDFAKYQCADAIALEREAYSVQRAYIYAYGRYLPVGVSMHNAGCEGGE